MSSTAVLVWNILFSVVGAAYFVYGKKQQETAPLICGLALMVFPYFVSNAWALFIVGAILMALPFYFRD
jgi:hypothetical protein